MLEKTYDKIVLDSEKLKDIKIDSYTVVDNQLRQQLDATGNLLHTEVTGIKGELAEFKDTVNEHHIEFTKLCDNIIMINELMLNRLKETTNTKVGVAYLLAIISIALHFFL